MHDRNDCFTSTVVNIFHSFKFILLKYVCFWHISNFRLVAMKLYLLLVYVQSIVYYGTFLFKDATIMVEPKTGLAILHHT